ncbi:MAG: haloacid dehalogenase-like hydrolase [Solirubrobacteraceae bacterium]|nr:haloacid dehalogenase-like hydrolase [Solirubrobacteraceae bacterium]
MLVLFDIDGTLLIRGAVEHAAALHDAIEQTWGLDLRGVRVPVGGRTDPEIARQTLLVGGVDASRIDERLPLFRERLVARYAELVPDDLSDRLAPGARRALEELAVRGARLSLVTGNLEGVARLKLRAAGIGGLFTAGQGGFGSDSEDRTDLPAIARVRAGRAWNGGLAWPRARAVVVGDTPRDIACARADGLRVVCVPTGPHPEDDLVGADALIGSLAELREALVRLGLQPGPSVSSAGASP